MSREQDDRGRREPTERRSNEPRPTRRASSARAGEPHRRPDTDGQPHRRPVAAREHEPQRRTASDAAPHRRPEATDRSRLRADIAERPRRRVGENEESSLSPALLIVAAAIVVILIIVLATTCTSCCQSSTPASSSSTAQVTLDDTASSGDTATALAALAKTDARVKQITDNESAYAVDGDAVQAKLLTLAANDPAAIDYVADFPSNYPQSTAASYDDTVSAGTIPRLYQWDERWGYTVYSSTAFGLTGCCPTAFSMVYMGLTGNNDYSPADMAALASQDGYESEYDGTIATFLVDEADRFGLYVSTPTVDASSLRESLGSGNVVICDMGAGDFTVGTHFIVVTGLNADGTVNINDPYSSVRSEKTWSIDDIVSQATAFYAYTA